MTETYILAHFPRLIQALMWVAILSEREAVACIRDHTNGYPFPGEAVNHFGGPAVCLRAASRARVRHFMLDCRIERRQFEARTPADYRSLGG